jgi:hypothetical protein
VFGRIDKEKLTYLLVINSRRGIVIYYLSGSTMATAADIRAQLAEKQQQLASEQERLNYLQEQTERSRQIYELSEKRLALTPTTDPNYSRLQAETQAEQSRYQQDLQAKNTFENNVITKTSDEINSLTTQLTEAEKANNGDTKRSDTTVDPKTDPSVNRDVPTLIRRREQLAREAQAAIDAGNRQLADSLLDQIIELDRQILVLDPSYRPGSLPVDAGSGGGTNDNNNNNNNDQSIIFPTQESVIGPQADDWRFRMSLAHSANYLYRAPNPGILFPLRATDGVIFPYSPSITITYSAGYNAQDITHSNYKIYTYKNSAVEAITISADFTAQDVTEANYLLAVIHFFRSVTKMFYGQDQNPSRGIPPPLVYLRGFGQYQFDWHPVAISSFTHTFPPDVDYIDAYPTNSGVSIGAQNVSPYINNTDAGSGGMSYQEIIRLGRQIQPGGLPPAPVFSSTQNINESTRVPTKITIQLNCLPIVTRNAISNKFSLKEYATGQLMKGSVNPGTGGGIW